MKKNILIIIMLISFMLLTINLKSNKEENKNEVTKIEKKLEKPAGIQVYTLEGEKTDISYSDLIKNYEIDSIICKNGTIATYNENTNEVNLSNIHMPDYCTMNFKERKMIALYDKLLENKTIVTTPRGGAYNIAFTDNTTGTLFQATESIAGGAAKTVYYFAGTPTDNWVKFGKYESDLVRGYNSNTTLFNDYNTMEECKSASAFNYNCSYVWKAGDDIYWRIIRTNHDGSIRMLYVGSSPDTTEGYLSGDGYNYDGESPKYVGYMIGDDDSTLESVRTNTKDSDIKKTLDTWYSSNLSSYTKYLSKEAVYCNDRQLGTGQTWNTSELYFAAYSRLGWEGTSVNPTYDCSYSRDAFSVNNTEAKLTYPIGLMTADEIVYAGTGGHRKSAAAWYTLNSAGNDITNDQPWWTLTPLYFLSYAEVADCSGSGSLYEGGSTFGGGHVTRPVISIKGETVWSKGDGSPENPYEIKYE